MGETDSQGHAFQHKGCIPEVTSRVNTGYLPELPPLGLRARPVPIAARVMSLWKMPLSLSSRPPPYLISTSSTSVLPSFHKHFLNTVYRVPDTMQGPGRSASKGTSTLCSGGKDSPVEGRSTTNGPFVNVNEEVEGINERMNECLKGQGPGSLLCSIPLWCCLEKYPLVLPLPSSHVTPLHKTLNGSLLHTRLHSNSPAWWLSVL